MFALKNIQKIGTDVVNMSCHSLPNNMNKVAFIVVNQYLGTPISLGDAPLNDGSHIAKMFSLFGYQVFYMLDPKCDNFISKFNYFLENTQNELIFYYVGHGANDCQLNEKAFIFKDKNIDRFTLSYSLHKVKNNNLKLILISDCCYAGSILDFDHIYRLPAKLLTITSTNGRQKARQLIYDRKEQGIFTFYFIEALMHDPSLTAQDCRAILKPKLKNFSQTVTISSSNREILKQPIFSMKQN